MTDLENHPVVIIAVFPFGTDGYKTETIKLLPNQKRFRIEMVAPVVSSSGTREVQFPKGTWKYKNSTIKGSVVKSFTVPLNELLIFEKIK